MNTVRAAESAIADLLNVGCGRRFSHDPCWVNADLMPASPEVRQIDASGRLPFANSTFAGVYHSHVLEHLDRHGARNLLLECFRVLRPSGVLRIAVPDLESIARSYLDRLNEARKGRQGARRRHEWAVLELCDQMARSTSGGGAIEFLRNPDPVGRAYAIERCGNESRGIIETIDHKPELCRGHTKPRLRSRLRSVPRKIKESLIRLILGKDYAALLAGRFTRSGELHRWMYDEYSLSNLLVELGFISVQTVRATESQIAGWADFNLDSDESGSPHKPDSLFIEAIRPAPGSTT